jgi:hypothetical protein
MNPSPSAVSPLVDLEARHDEALRQLAELELRIEAVLKEALPASSAWPAIEGSGSPGVSDPAIAFPAEAALDTAE